MLMLAQQAAAAFPEDLQLQVGGLGWAGLGACVLSGGRRVQAADRAAGCCRCWCCRWCRCQCCTWPASPPSTAAGLLHKPPTPAALHPLQDELERWAVVLINCTRRILLAEAQLSPAEAEVLSPQEAEVVLASSKPVYAVLARLRHLLGSATPRQGGQVGGGRVQGVVGGWQGSGEGGPPAACPMRAVPTHHAHPPTHSLTARTWPAVHCT